MVLKSHLSSPVVFFFFFLPHYTAKRDGTRTPDSEAQGRRNHWIVRDFPSMVSFLIIQYVYLHPTFSFLSMSSPTFFFFFLIKLVCYWWSLARNTSLGCSLASPQNLSHFHGSLLFSVV